MNRELLVSIGSVTLLCAALLGYMMLPDRRRPEPDVGPQAAAPASPAPVLLASVPAAQPVAAELAATPRAEEPSSGQPAAYPTDPAQLVRALRPLQQEVAAALDDLGARTQCQLRDVLVDLVLETGKGKVVIQEVSVRLRPPEPDPAAPDHDPAAFAPAGAPDEAVVHCLQDALEGKTLRAPSAMGGRRWQMTWQSIPRAG